MKLKKENIEKDDIINNIKNHMRKFETERLDLLDERAKLAKLYDMGLIDNSGDPILVEPPEFKWYKNERWVYEVLMNKL